MFFSEQKKPSRRKKKKPKPGNWFTRNIFRPIPLVFLAIFTALGVLAPRFYEKLPNLAEESKYQFSIQNISIAEQPNWVPAHFLESVLAKHQLPESILEPSLAQTLSKWFASETWVEEVEQVSISFPPQVLVKLKFREPVAVTEIDSVMVPVDGEAVVLPPEDFAPTQIRRFPVIEHNAKWAPSRPGMQWHDAAIQKAAILALKLKPVWSAYDFHTIREHKRHIDSTQQGSARQPLSAKEPLFELVSRSGSVVIWGRAPSSKHPGELSFDKKVGRLQAYQEQFKGFALPHGPYEIDLTPWVDINRKPLSRTASAAMRSEH